MDTNLSDAVLGVYRAVAFRVDNKPWAEYYWQVLTGLEDKDGLYTLLVTEGQILQTVDHFRSELVFGASEFVDNELINPKDGRIRSLDSLLVYGKKFGKLLGSFTYVYNKENQQVKDEKYKRGLQDIESLSPQERIFFYSGLLFRREEVEFGVALAKGTRHHAKSENKFNIFSDMVRFYKDVFISKKKKLKAY